MKKNLYFHTQDDRSAFSDLKRTRIVFPSVSRTGSASCHFANAPFLGAPPPASIATHRAPAYAVRSDGILSVKDDFCKMIFLSDRLACKGNSPAAAKQVCFFFRSDRADFSCLKPRAGNKGSSC